MWLDGTIKSKGFLNDIGLGMTAPELRKKYGLSSEQFHTVLRDLLEADAMTPEDFHVWAICRDTEVTLEHFRLSRRQPLSFGLPIFEESRVENSGTVMELSSYGLRIRGLQAKAGDIMHLAIRHDGFYRASDLTIEAGCRWSRKDEIGETMVSGFFIVTTSDGTWEDFCRLMAVLDS